ncbi:MAG: type IV pilus assembly protein PilM [Pirellulales bacterium]
MVGWWTNRRAGPIGVDIGSHSVKLLQLNGDRTSLIERSRWDLPAAAERQAPAAGLAEALKRAYEGRGFQGRDAVVSLGSRELFVQNVRVDKVAGGDLDRMIRQEVAERIPFALEEAEIRYLEAADVRQQEVTRREVIVLACHRPVLEQLLLAVREAGLHPVAVDVEPAALLRCYATQFRRDEDKAQRALFVHVGAANTAVVIAQGTDALFIKYLDVGGRNLDESVARHLGMEPAEAWALRRHNGDRRTDQQDPEVALSLMESTRPVVDRLANEISLCVRYHSVTFRGQPLARLVLGGGEASQALADTLATRLNLKCELGDPLRPYEPAAGGGRKSQWDVAAGLAMRDLN